ncbi:hypothetical protein XELAEV_18020046mg [Xenopus laevis]|uniref:RING-type domain-containing protein n=1 Tax=Xenopus laevis TaxID=8355 RepID=A0A974D709_XENLA|nr:hypothetical protein XELAEV_18020046mg [Xenopus laevis]
MDGSQSQYLHIHLGEIPENVNQEQGFIPNGVNEEPQRGYPENISQTQALQASRIIEAPNQQANTRIRTRGQMRRLYQKIARLPQRIVGEDDNNDLCIICMSNYESGEKVNSLPCNHQFHSKCIRQWLIEHPVCPLCMGPFCST